RALAINPELSVAHHLYAQLEMETGRSVEAFVRLLDRARERRADPQLFAGLVQASRYVGRVQTLPADRRFRAPRQPHEPSRALDALERTVDAGLACPAALDGHPMLRTLRDDPRFEPMRATVEHRHRRAVETFETAGGFALLT